MKAQVVLTTPEAKRLVAKAVARHRGVRTALEDGILAIALGTTNAYVAEELLGREMEKERYAAGFLDELGACVVPEKDRLGEIVLEKGEPVQETTAEVVKRMGPGDVFIKGANAIDMDGVCGVMLASETGGTVAKVLGVIKARGVIPVTLDKLVPGSISDISCRAGIYRMGHSTGIPVGVMPVTGEVITEVEAFDILFGVDAEPMGSGDYGSAGNPRMFLLEGTAEDVGEAVKLVEGIKGEPPLPSMRGPCRSCGYTHCPNHGGN
ncbi:MAG: hypothetical protein GXO65_00390 [Euryarchaeota archaeon]|nr:hypothetical protein [Euryarchaeota archaeon]